MKRRREKEKRRKEGRRKERKRKKEGIPTKADLEIVT